MAPKIKVTREDIINTAIDIVRNEGEQAINARNIAAALSCSTQPVFSNFATMQELKLAVVEAADLMCAEYRKAEVEKGEFPEYKANGMAYIRFAKEEKELFKLLYMRDRSNENSPLKNDVDMQRLVQNNTKLESKQAELFHLEVWAFVHGIAVMFATGFLDLPWKLVSEMLSDAYLGLKKQFGIEE